MHSVNRRVVEDQDDADAAEAAALRILAGASQAASALERRLRQRGFSLRAARAAVARCRELGYIDDDAFARAVVNRHLRAGHGRGLAVADLRRRGVSSSVAAEALGVIDEDEQQGSAAALAQRLYDRERAREDFDFDGARRRIGAALQRRGFSSSVILRALREVQT